MAVGKIDTDTGPVDNMLLIEGKTCEPVTHKKQQISFKMSKCYAAQTLLSMPNPIKLATKLRSLTGILSRMGLFDFN